MSTAIKLDKKGKLRLSEADVTAQVCDFMAAEGWRGVRNNVGGSYSAAAVTILLKLLEEDRGALNHLTLAIKRVRSSFLQFGEPGMPDWEFMRYVMSKEKDVDIYDGYRAATEVIWIEFKAPGKKPTPEQLVWHEAERARGALVKVVDKFEPFRNWYREVFS